MNTTQKRPEAAAPPSAQQQNGAARTPEQQRGSAPRPARNPEAPAGARTAVRKEAPARREAPERKAAPDTREAPRKKNLASPEEPRKKRPAPEEEPRKKPKAPAGKKPAAAAAKTRTGSQERKKAAPGRKAKQQEPEHTRGLPDSVSTKKRSYGNSKPKKKTVVDRINDAVKRAGERKAEKIVQRQAEREKAPAARKPRTSDAPAVIYTDPENISRSRILMQLLTMLAVVVALVMGLSVFFKVKTIRISGAEVYSNWAVRNASGIEEGDNLLTFSHARAGAKIKANLPYVKNVRFGIKLPDTVNIMIEEEDVVYAIKDNNNGWWLMNSKGKILEQSNQAGSARYTQVLGVTVADPVINEYAVATESAIVYETKEDGSTEPIPVSVTGAQRLNAALNILQALESNDIVGEAASVDVSRMEDIVLWYGTRFQVNLGDSGNLAYKIDCMNDCILQMGEYQTGVMDISFTIWPNQVGFTPFS